MNRFGELLEKLARADVRYVLVGGGAVLLHGHARVTNDLDILVEASEENARRLLGALATWGEGAGAELGLEELTPPQAGALRVVEGFTLDIFTLMRARALDADVTYGDLLADAQHRTLSNGVSIAYASIDRLLELKANTGRPKDVADIAILTEIALGRRQRQPVDLARMQADSAAGSSDQGNWPVDPPAGNSGQSPSS